MYAHAHTHENMTRGSFTYIVHQIFFSLISLVKFLCHNLNLNSAALQSVQNGKKRQRQELLIYAASFLCHYVDFSHLHF